MPIVNTDENNCIASGLRADVMRKMMENKNVLNVKGSIYVGTGDADKKTDALRPIPGTDNYKILTYVNDSVGLVFCSLDEVTNQTYHQAASYSMRSQADAPQQGRAMAAPKTVNIIEEKNNNNGWNILSNDIQENKNIFFNDNKEIDVKFRVTINYVEEKIQTSFIDELYMNFTTDAKKFIALSNNIHGVENYKNEQYQLQWIAERDQNNNLIPTFLALKGFTDESKTNEINFDTNPNYNIKIEYKIINE